MAYVIDINDSTVDFSRQKYDEVLNNISYFEVVVKGADSTVRGNLAVGNQVDIYRNGTREIKGIIYNSSIIEGGSILVKGHGEEVELTDYDCPVDSGKNTKTYLSTTDNVIFADLVSNAAGWSSDVTGSSATSLDAFRVSESQTLWEGINSLRELTGKDVEVDYDTKTLKLLDSKGSASAFRFTEGLNMSNITQKKGRPKASKVIVYGKGDGIFQIIGTAGSGTPVKKLQRPNIIDPSVANILAATELAKITNSEIYYSFIVTDPTLNLVTGDQGKIDSGTVGLSDVSVDITKVVRKVGRNNIERLEIEVTNPELRIASKNTISKITSETRQNQIKETSMQGGPNFNSWGAGINAKTNFPLQVIFYLSEDQMEDEAGNLRINSLTVDYDIDPYKKSVGTASFDGGDPQVQRESADTVADLDGATESAEGGDAGKVTDSATLNQPVTFTSTSTEYTIDTLDGGLSDTQKIGVWVSGVYSGDSTISSFDFRLLRNGSAVDFNDPVISYVLSNNSDRTIVYAYLEAPENTNGRDYDVLVEIRTGSVTSEQWLFNLSYQTTRIHKHSVGSYATENHLHQDGTYEVDSTDIDDITIGDDISEDVSLNSSSVNLYLDFWNGSSWTNKHSILNTTKTLDTDVDISNSDVYPDAVGYWRVRVEPIAASPDYAQAIVKIKHNLDS